MYTTRTGITWQRIGLTQFRTKFRIHAYERTNDSERGGTSSRINTKWFVWQVVCVVLVGRSRIHLLVIFRGVAGRTVVHVSFCLDFSRLA